MTKNYLLCQMEWNWKQSLFYSNFIIKLQSSITDHTDLLGNTGIFNSLWCVEGVIKPEWDMCITLGFFCSVWNRIGVHGTAVWLAIRLYRHWCSQWGCFWRNVWRRLMNKEERPHSVRSALTPSFTPPVTIKTYIHWCCKTSDRAESFSHIYSFSSSEGLLLISVNEAVSFPVWYLQRFVWRLFTEHVFTECFCLQLWTECNFTHSSIFVIVTHTQNIQRQTTQRCLNY